MQLIHNKTRLCEGASRLVAEAHDPPFFTSTKMKFSRWGGGETGIGFLETSLLFCRSYFITTRIANTCEAAEAMKILGNRFL